METMRSAPAVVSRLATSLAVIGSRAGGLVILACVAEVGDDRGDGRSRRAPQGVDQHQQFDQGVVDRLAGGLDDVGVDAAHALLDLDVHLAFVEGLEAYLAQVAAQHAGHFQRQLGTGAPGEEPEAVTEVGVHQGAFGCHQGVDGSTGGGRT